MYVVETMIYPILPELHRKFMTFKMLEWFEEDASWNTWPWKWRQKRSFGRQSLFSNRRGRTTRKSLVFSCIAVRFSNLTVQVFRVPKAEWTLALCSAPDTLQSLCVDCSSCCRKADCCPLFPRPALCTRFTTPENKWDLTRSWWNLQG